MWHNPPWCWILPYNWLILTHSHSHTQKTLNSTNYKVFGSFSWLARVQKHCWCQQRAEFQIICFLERKNKKLKGFVCHITSVVQIVFLSIVQNHCHLSHWQTDWRTVSQSLRSVVMYLSPKYGSSCLSLEFSNVSFFLCRALICLQSPPQTTQEHLSCHVP